MRLMLVCVTLSLLGLGAFTAYGTIVARPITTTATVLADSTHLAQSGVLRVFNFRAMTSDADEKTFGVPSIQPASLRLTSAGESVLMSRRFTLRAFRSDPSGRPHPVGTDENGCEIYYSVLLESNLSLGALMVGRLNERWLGRGTGGLTRQTYVLMLEEGGQKNDVLKLRPGVANAYFMHGFKIVVIPDHPLTDAQVNDVMEWGKNGPNYQHLIKEARCLENNPLLVAGLRREGADLELVAPPNECAA